MCEFNRNFSNFIYSMPMIDFSKMHSPPSETGKRHPPKQFAIGLVLLVVVVSLIFMMGPYSIFAPYETYSLIVLLCAPMGIALYLWAKDWLVKFILPKPNVTIFFGVIFSLIAVNCVLSVNSSGGPYPKETATFVVTEKYKKTPRTFNSGPDRTIKYYIAYPHPDFTPLPFFVTNSETIKIDEEQYATVISGQTTVTVTYSLGKLGIPWRTNYTLNNPE